MEIDLQLVYSKGKARVQFARYENGRVAIRLSDVETGEPTAVSTINMPEVDLADDEVIVKDYGENDGMDQTLEAAGLVEFTERSVQAGYRMCGIATLTQLAKDALAKQG